MAKVTITLTDGLDDDGLHIVTGEFQVDHEGAPEDAAHTLATLFGTAIQRLWKSRALAPLVPLLCEDLMALTPPETPARRKAA